jgi:hypothetical protein
VIAQALQGCAGACKCSISRRLSLLRVAPYCVPGGVRVVSILPCICLTLTCTSTSCIHIGQALSHAIDRRTSASACCILQSASGQVLMDRPHRHNAFTHGRGAPLDRAAAHVAGCEFSRHPRLNEERPPRTFLAEVPFEHGAAQRFPLKTKLRSSRSTASSSQPVLASAPKRPTTSHPTEPKRPRIPNYCERRRSVTPMCCGP